MNNVFKIRNNNTGEFSRGKGSPAFSKAGYTWSSRAALNAHLAWFRKSYNNCSIVEYELIEKSTEPLGTQEPDKNQPIIPELKDLYNGNCD